jgi:hypothetical protein
MTAFSQLPPGDADPFKTFIGEIGLFRSGRSAHLLQARPLLEIANQASQTGRAQLTGDGQAGHYPQSGRRLLDAAVPA